MQNTNKVYKPSASDKADEIERKAHEEEMHRAMKRLLERKERKKKAFLCAAAGFILGVLYVIFISNGEKIILSGGISLYEAYIGLAGGNGALTLALDFLPPYLLSLVASLVISKGQKGKLYYIITGALTLTIVITIFLLYMSYTAII